VAATVDLTASPTTYVGSLCTCNIDFLKAKAFNSPLPQDAGMGRGTQDVERRTQDVATTVDFTASPTRQVYYVCTFGSGSRDADAASMGSCLACEGGSSAARVPVLLPARGMDGQENLICDYPWDGVVGRGRSCWVALRCAGEDRGEAGEGKGIGGYCTL
jgi:hypothetical protein